MKRFLILFIVIAYSAVGCAGSNNWTKQWTKPDFDPSKFREDRIECKQSIDKNLVSDAFGKALEECLGEKGYEYQKTEYKAPQPNKLTTVETILLGVVMIPLVAAFLILSAGGGLGAGFRL